MQINFWKCPYHDYDESWDGETEMRFYICKHPRGDGCCDLDNKYSGCTDDCSLLDPKDLPPE